MARPAVKCIDDDVDSLIRLQSAADQLLNVSAALFGNVRHIASDDRTHGARLAPTSIVCKQYGTEPWAESAQLKAADH